MNPQDKLLIQAAVIDEIPVGTQLSDFWQTLNQELLSQKKIRCLPIDDNASPQPASQLDNISKFASIAARGGADGQLSLAPLEKKVSKTGMVHKECG